MGNTSNADIGALVRFEQSGRLAVILRLAENAFAFIGAVPLASSRGSNANCPHEPGAGRSLEGVRSLQMLPDLA
jgi:hypothetical protein